MHWISDGTRYLADVRSEFNKITWPGRKEYVGGTVGVVVIVAFLTLVLWMMDFALTQVMELLLG